MFRNTIRIGRVLGIPVGLDYSWFFIFALLTWMLASSYFPGEFTDWQLWLYWLMGGITSIMFFASVLLHELGHSIIALHFELPVRSITLFIFGGVAQITTEPRSAWSEFWIAIAGPIVSIALALFFYLIEPLVAGVEPLLALVKYLSYINLVLALFNLVPGFPLDGGRVLRAIVWGVTRNFGKSTRIAATVGRAFAFVFIYLGVMQIFSGNIVGGLWIIFIGWFLDSAAVAQVHQQELRSALSGHIVAEAMNPNFAVIPADMSLEDVIMHHVLGVGRRSVIVLDKDDNVIGMLTLHQLQKVAREDMPRTPVSAVMIPTSQFKAVTPQTDLWSVLEEMDSDGVNQLPVMKDGKVVGIITREDLITFLKLLHIK